MLNVPDGFFTHVCAKCQTVNEISNDVNVFTVNCFECKEKLFKGEKIPTTKKETFFLKCLKRSLSTVKKQVDCELIVIDKPNLKTELCKLPWLGYFRTTEFGQVLSKTALIKGDKIGAYNPFGQLIWIERDLKVIIVW